MPGQIPPGLVERAVEAAWPGARTETVPAVPPLSGPGVATGGALCLALPEHYPLRTGHKVDPLRPLLGALAGLAEGESACVQILARPVTGRRLTRLQRAAAARRSGRPVTRIGRLVDLVTPGPSAQAPGSDPSRSADVADILDKAAQPCWAISVRYALSTTATDRQAGARLRGRAHAVASAFALFAGRNRFERHRLAHPARVLAERRFGRGDLVSVAELAALAHLPTDVSVPGLARAGANAVAPPPAVARPASRVGSFPDRSRALDTPKLLGDAQAGGRRPVTLAVPDARYHLHVMGATGSGKSTLLTNLVLGDIAAGRGVVVIDPKGDLITDLCDRLPDGAESRTVLIDPEDPDAAPVLNVLAGPDPDLAVDNLVGIFRSIFAAFWGPRTDDVLRSACLTLLRYAASSGTSTSLADVPRLLADNAFRAPRVAAVADDTVGLGGFWDSYEAMTEANRAQVIGPVMNKLRAFLAAGLRTLGRRPARLQLRHGPGPRRRHLPGPGAQGHPGRGDRPPARLVRRGQGVADRHPPSPARTGRPGRRVARGRRVPELLAPAPQLRRDAGRGPRLPALHGARPSAPRPAPQRATRGGLVQRPDQGVVLDEPRGRARSLPPCRPRGLRARPVPPRRVHRRGSPRGRRRGDPRLHAPDPARTARHPRSCPGGP